MSSQPTRKMTPEEYLAFERSSEEKHEFYLGKIFAMSGASRAHNRISLNIGSLLTNQFQGRNCEAFVADMRVGIETDGSYVYPDVVAACHEMKFIDEKLDTLTNPQLIVEVLSDSTESYDRGKKFARYRSIESLTDFIFVAQDRISIEHFIKKSNGNWEMRPCQTLDEIVNIDSLNCELELRAVYDKVEFVKQLGLQP